MNGRGSSASALFPPTLQSVDAIAVADADNDGVLDLLAVQSDGAIVRISDKNKGESWDTAEIAHVPNSANNLAADVRMRIADLDNNGALDLVLAPTAQVSNSKGHRRHRLAGQW